MLWRLANQSLLAHLLVELHRANYHAPELNAAVRVTTCRFVIDLLEQKLGVSAALGVFIPSPASKPMASKPEPSRNQVETVLEEELLPQEAPLPRKEQLQLVALVARINVRLPRGCEASEAVAVKSKHKVVREFARADLSGLAVGESDSKLKAELAEDIPEFKEEVSEDAVKEDTAERGLIDDGTASSNAGPGTRSSMDSGSLRISVAAPKAQPSISKLRFIGAALMLAKHTKGQSEEVSGKMNL